MSALTVKSDADAITERVVLLLIFPLPIINEYEVTES